MPNPVPHRMAAAPALLRFVAPPAAGAAEVGRSSTRVRSCAPTSPPAVPLAAAAGGAIDCARRFPFLVEVLAIPHVRKGASLWQAFTPSSAPAAVRTLRLLRKFLMPGRLHPPR